MSAIVFKDFKCFYKSKKKKQLTQVLFDINLEIEEGEFLVVVGESGCGKTTLLKACLGLADAFDGDLYIEGRSIEEVNTKNGDFAYIRQEFALFPNMTVYENIALPLRVMKAPQKEVDERVKEIAAAIGMPLLLNRKPKQLSIGQQQRVALGRALIKNPRFLFMDEPFSNLDTRLRMELRQLVKLMHREMRPTVIFVTHELSEAFLLADRILVLEDGRVAEIGTPDSLKQEHRSMLLKAFFNEDTDNETDDI